MKVVVDTNVYISALVFGGAAIRVLDMARDEKIDLYISRVILDETLGVMARDKFQLTKADVAEATTIIRTIAR